MKQKIKKNKIFISSMLAFSLTFLAFSNLAYASEISVSRVIDLVNKSRSDKGIYELSENKTLNKIAQDKLEDMIKNNYFAHTSPKGVTPWSWFEKERYDYKYAGENLAINFMTTESQHKAWMDSPTHRKNIMNPLFQEIGVAVAAGEINNQMAIITVQEFGTLAGAGEAVNKKDNFSGKEKNNILKENAKISPTVLSVKNTNKENYLNFGKDAKEPIILEKGYFSDMKNYFAKNKNIILEDLQMISALVLVIALSLIPAVFIFEAMKAIRNYVILERKIKQDTAQAVK